MLKFGISVCNDLIKHQYQLCVDTSISRLQVGYMEELFSHVIVSDRE